ncbi:DNA replication factor Dna2-domain-containing protein [Mycotypha africana]|uniref:DNA replication factor Dna2-domain-containing protein n=1 Tax=Mycotypha africana TaxID=64632 RepID=UPI002300C145|nr:DNA replication factor Dna2-domain-containing protein [Mycotypha africana]KAI8968967.1 DNA replication factor Dna2-domain-containing protein [Mycotypha africana]
MSMNKRLKTNHVTVEIEDEDEDEFMFDDDIDIENVNISAILEAKKKREAKADAGSSATQTPVQISSFVPEAADSQQRIYSTTRRKFSRYLVANVTHGQYTLNDDSYPEKVLTLSEECANCSAIARLRQDWKNTIVAVGDVIHIPYIQNAREIIIDNENNFIIVNPDQLISCTAVADSFACLRKSVMQMKVKGASEYSEALVHGNIIHKVLQNALESDDFSIENIRKNLELVVQNSLEDLYAISQDEKIAMAVLGNYVDSIHNFGATFVNDNPKPNARLSTDIGPDALKEMGCDSIAISKVLDIEEHLWSPTFGLKGMVDASVQLKLSPTKKVLTVPFELKTGRTSAFLTNRAQTLLYTLLMSDRYDVDIQAGVLYYSKTNSLYVVPSARSDIRLLIMARNELAVAFKHKASLPAMIKDSHTCQHCFLNDTCSIYHKAIENGTGETSGLYKLFEEKTDHMTEATCAFFKHWWQLLEKEESNIDYVRKDIWSQPANIREMNGRCLGNMVLNLPACEINHEIARWKYSFVRSQSKRDQQLLCNMNSGDPVVVSSMEGHINLAMGFITAITPSEIILTLAEPLRSPPQAGEDFIQGENESFHTFVRFSGDIEGYYSRRHIEYRIDKDDMATGMNLLRHNLVKLVAKNSNDERGRRLRELIIDLEKPIYNTTNLHLPPTPHMNPDQRNALKHVLKAKDYSLILGMPGTGKTTTTAEIINYLVSQNKTVLVAAYTHSALDNILHKVRKHGIELLRLGNVDKVMPSLRDCDSYQLPPIVRNKEALEDGLDKSLFNILAEARPEAVTYLEYQYRMAKDIMDVSNLLIYDGKMKCGNHRVATRSLKIPALEAGLKTIHQGTSGCLGSSTCWLRSILDPR